MQQSDYHHYETGPHTQHLSLVQSLHGTDHVLVSTRQLIQVLSPDRKIQRLHYCSGSYSNTRVQYFFFCRRRTIGRAVAKLLITEDDIYSKACGN
jgi:hypothetical protein